ncbi:two-component regulator propeller domain-containing protein, partial [Balneolaceae bacterium ANBcel3]|nr:two-component regulator propeller domain-containing protein [Balneolaceae bacterium ANBcel3]
MKLKYTALAPVLFCLLMMATFPVSGQPTELFSFDHLNRPDGLSHSTPTAIMQDHEGVIWIGTVNGLNKFNSVEFQVFRNNPVDSNSLSGSSISTLYEDRDHNLWIGTSGTGLNVYDRDTQTFTRIMTDYVDHASSISDNTITAIIENSLDELWIGTMSGLNYYDRKKDVFYHFFANPEYDNIPSSSHITALEECHNQHLWIGTVNGLNMRDQMTGAFRHFLHDPEDPSTISHNTVNDLLVADNGMIWIATERGVDMYDPETDRISRISYLPEGVEAPVRRLHMDFEGYVWIGTSGQGLVRLDTQTKTTAHIKTIPNYPYSLSGNNVYSIYESDNRVLWVGTENGGLNVLDLKPANFEYYHDQSAAGYGLSARSVVSFLETSGGEFLVGTGGGGVNVFDRKKKTFKAYTFGGKSQTMGLENCVVLSLLKDSKGAVWAGYYDKGVTRYDPETGSLLHFVHDPDVPGTISSNDVYGIYEDREETIWLATNDGGVNRYDPETQSFIHLTDFANGMDATRTLLHDSRDNFWVGSYGGGLRIKDRRSHEVIRHMDQGEVGLMSHIVLAIFED